jgi:5'-3' exonuclease
MSKSFTKLTATETFEDSVLIVDGLNLAFRYKHQKATEFADDYIRTVYSLAKSYHCGNIIVCADWGSSAYRKAIYPEYKQNRVEQRANQSVEDEEYFEVFIQEFSRTLDQLRELGIKVLRFKGVEADDVAAYLVKKRRAFNFNQIWLISSDRDWDTLIAHGVSRFSYVTRKEITVENWMEHYDCSTPEDYISIKCLMGDTGDNVPGVAKVGPKTAVKLVEQYGSALDIANQLPLDGKYVYIKNLNAFGSEQIIRNYQLMDLLSFCEDAIGSENIETINKELG